MDEAPVDDCVLLSDFVSDPVLPHDEKKDAHRPAARTRAVSFFVFILIPAFLMYVI